MPTVDRLTTAGLAPELIEQHHTGGRIDGELVDDPDTPAPHGTRIVLMTDRVDNGA